MSSIALPQFQLRRPKWLQSKMDIAVLIVDIIIVGLVGYAFAQKEVRDFSFEMYGRVFSGDMWVIVLAAGAMLYVIIRMDNALQALSGRYKYPGARLGIRRAARMAWSEKSLARTKSLVLNSTNWSWLEMSLFPWKLNFSLGALNRHWLIGIPYTFVLLVCVPVFAFMEEMLFRVFLNIELTSILGNQALAIVAGSLMFGIVHMIVGVTCRMALLNSFAGLCLSITMVVMIRHFDAETTLWSIVICHAMYNLMAIAWLVKVRFTKGAVSS